MKKLILFIAIFVLLFNGCQQNLPTTPPVAPPQNSGNNNLQNYQSSTHHFEFQYPPEFVFTEANYANLDEKIVQIQLPSAAFPGTNFGDAGFAVSAVQSKNDCLTINLPEGSSGFQDQEVINGATFSKTNGSGAGAGNFYESKTYRTERNSACYEINEVIHTANIANYDQGSVTAVDKTQIWTKLDAILATFTFTS